MEFNRPNLDFIVSLFNNTKLKKIVNVYQKNYTNIQAQGFGDFLRGSIYLTYISKLLKLDFDIEINHPIKLYLKNDIKTDVNIPYNEIKAWIDYYNNRNNEINFIKSFIEELNNYQGEIYYTFNNFKPLFPIANPKFNIIQKARNIINPKIFPNSFLLTQLDQRLKKLGLKRKEYAVIQVRCGDYFMNIKKYIDSEKHQISSKHLNDIIKFINKYFNKDKKYILIGDSVAVKNIIALKFPFISKFNSQITHLGEDSNQSEEAILDTLIDFNIMKFSNFIISFSAYGHGSGFSKYCAVLNNIPYKQILLQPSLNYRI